VAGVLFGRLRWKGSASGVNLAGLASAVKGRGLPG
jgi:hypothetical protein